MFTEQMNRNKSNTYIQMKTNISPDTRIMKLGGAITSSIQKLNDLKSQIMKSTPGSDLMRLVLDFKKEHQYFIRVSEELNEVQQNTEAIIRLRTKVKQFLEGFKPEQIQQKTKNMRQNLIRASQQKGPDFYQSGQIQMETQISLRKRLLQQQQEQLKQLQKIMSQISRIAINTSRMIEQQGVKLNIAATSLSQAKRKLQQGRKQLNQANKYEKNTNKKKFFFCMIIVAFVGLVLLLMIASRK